MAAPHQDAMPYGRFRSLPDETASNRKLSLTTPKECGCDEDSAKNVAVRSKPINTHQHSLDAWQQRRFFFDNKPSTHEKKQNHVG